MIEITTEELTQSLTDKGFSESQIKYVIDNVGVLKDLPKSILKKIFDAQQIRFLMKLFDVTFMAQDLVNTGWADDITTNARRHYYKNGLSLCGKSIAKHFFKFYIDIIPNKYAKDCSICIKKLKQLKTF